MSERASRRILWVAFAATVPLPFFLVETGWVPAVRLLLLAGVHGAVIAVEGTQGTVAIAAALLLAQAALGLAALWVLAWGLAQGLSRGSPRRAAAATWAVVALALFVTTAFDLYRTPFRTPALRGNLLVLLE